MPSRRHLALAAIAVWFGVALTTPTSGATFVASTRTTASVRAAADWTAPAVAVRDPGSPLRGTTVLAADVTDQDSAIASVTIETQTGASNWSVVCVDTTAPYECAWATTAVSDGAWNLRARASDTAGNSATSAQVGVVVANALLVLLDDPGPVLRGSASLHALAYGTGLTGLTLRIEYVAAGGSSWRTACSGLGANVTCTWATTTVSSQEYDLRAVAVIGTATYTSAVLPDVLVDNVAPAVTMTNPGSPLRGSVTLGATATDAHSGVADIVMQYAVSGGSVWRTACTTTDPDAGTCRFDTTTIADGSYDLRAVATDVAGNSTTSATITSRLVDNTVTSVSMEDPGSWLSGTVALKASAASTSGITGLTIQAAVSGGGSWSDVCNDATAPYSCSWDTTRVANGIYDLRAVATDGTGGLTVSATVAARHVDNSPLRALDVQASNGAGSAGRLDSGDQLVLTYSGDLDLASVSTGWTGTALPVSLRIRDGGLLGLGAKSDTVDILRNGSPLALGSINLTQEYIKNGKTVVLAATLTATSGTGTTGGRTTVVTVTLGAVTSGTGLRGGNAGAMIWTPSALAKDTAGRPCAGLPAIESGPLERDF